MLFLILILVLVVLSLYYTIEDFFLLKFYRVPPGPISLPLIGGLYRLDRHQPHLSFSELIPKYGKLISLRFGTAGQRAVIIHDPQIAQKIFSNLDVLDRPNIPYFDVITPHGAGIGSRPYDKIWKLHTRIIRSAINKISSNSFTFKAEQTLDILFERWASSDNMEQDIIHDLQLASLSLVANICYGINFKDWTKEDMKSLLDDNRKALEGLSPFHPINLCSFIKHFPLEVVRKIEGITQRRDELNKKMYKEHVDNYTGKIYDIMDMVVDVMETGKNTSNLTISQQQLIDRNNLFMSFTALFMAGLDNLCFIMHWTVLALATHPEITEKIYQELENTMGMDSMIGIEARSHLPYTEAAIMEIMRLTSLTALNVPHTNRSEIEIDKYRIPTGTMIFLNIWYIHNSEEYWENHDKLNPERFLDSNGQLKPEDHDVYQNYIPFGTGKRTCIGNTLSTNFLFMFTCNLIRRFSFKISDPSISLIGTCEMLHVPKKYKVIFEKRETTEISSK